MSEEMGFFQWCSIVNRELVVRYGVDIDGLGIDADRLMDHHDAHESPVKFAAWFGEKYDLRRLEAKNTMSDKRPNPDYLDELVMRGDYDDDGELLEGEFVEAIKALSAELTRVEIMALRARPTHRHEGQHMMRTKGPTTGKEGNR